MDNSAHPTPKQCPYISTIRKNTLDFDFQKICSISLSHTNIYTCLVCGRYFQGRSSTSPAYQHSIECSHYIFMNLQNSKVYCLPDDYEVDSYTLDDIKFNLKPTYSEEMLNQLQRIEDVEYNVDGKEFYPGVIGMNNLGKTDFANVVIYLLNGVREVRRFFVLAGRFQNQVVNQFGLLLKKIWNPKSFKGVVSPHQFLQSITNASNKKFKIGTNSDPTTFLLWLIDTLSKSLKKQKRPLSPLSALPHKFDLQNLFRGKLKTSIIKGIKNSYEYEQIPSKIQDVQFSILRFQFPEQGVFNKTQSQVGIDLLMGKYVGKVGEKHQLGLRYAKIIEFPQYLVLVFKRFSSNGYSIQKDNSHLLYSLKLQISSNNTKSTYKLQSQICHSGDYETGKYKIILNMQQAQKWFQIEDLEVREIIQKQVLLAQPMIQVYRLVKLEKMEERVQEEWDMEMKEMKEIKDMKEGKDCDGMGI